MSVTWSKDDQASKYQVRESRSRVGVEYGEDALFIRVSSAKGQAL